MDKFPLMRAGSAVGELAVEREALYTRFTARCRLPGEAGLWCAWAVGRTGELRLGVLEPADGELTISRRFSARMTQPLGPLERGEVRPAGAEREANPWRAEAAPERLFRTPWLRRQLRGAQGALARPWPGGVELALPYTPREPFPLTPMFCLAGVRRIGERRYAVYRFDRQERPVPEMGAEPPGALDGDGRPGRDKNPGKNQK